MQRHTTKLQQNHQAVLESVLRGDTCQQIADSLQVSLESVRKYLRQHELKAQRPPHHRLAEIDRAELQTLLNSGLTQKECAKALGVTRKAIENRVRWWGLKTARTGPRSGAGHKSCWRNGRVLEKHGYIGIYAPLHPYAKVPVGRVSEHRLVMEVVLGRYLEPTEVVHHHDDTPYHNWPSNLGTFACNADHLRHELTGKPYGKTPRRVIPGAYCCYQTIDRCPDESETLAQAPSEIRQKLERYIASHRPTTEHQHLPRRSLLRSGAWRPPFESESTE